MRDLLIGVAGGLIVLALGVGWRIVRAAGLRGLLHLRRSSAKSDLRWLQSLPGGQIAFLARLVAMNGLHIAFMCFGVVAALVVISSLALSGVAISSRSAWIVAGAVGSFMLGATLGHLHLSRLILRAVIDYDKLIATLTERAGPATSNLPAGDGP